MKGTKKTMTLKKTRQKEAKELRKLTGVKLPVAAMMVKARETGFLFLKSGGKLTFNELFKGESRCCEEHGFTPVSLGTVEHNGKVVAKYSYGWRGSFEFLPKYHTFGPKELSGF